MIYSKSKIIKKIYMSENIRIILRKYLKLIPDILNPQCIPYTDYMNII